LPAITEQQPSVRTGLFWRYWTDSTVSNVGDAISAVALPLTAVTVLHASSFQVSLVTAATYVAWVVVGLPVGVIVHRLPLRATQFAMDMVRAAVLASVPLAAWAHVRAMAQLVVVALLVSLASVVFDVGNSTFMVSVVSKAEFTRRNSFNSGTFSVTQMAGVRRVCRQAGGEGGVCVTRAREQDG